VNVVTCWKLIEVKFHYVIVLVAESRLLAYLLCKSCRLFYWYT